MLLFIEVARSRLFNDLAEKRELCAKAGIQDYRVVDVDDNSVRVFREPSPQGYRYQKTDVVSEPLRPLAFPQVQLEVPQLF